MEAAARQVATATALVPLEEADAPVKAEIERRMAEIDMGNSQSIIEFGSAAAVHPVAFASLTSLPDGEALLFRARMQLARLG